ncbi:TadE/TadG family type IV pilus assembly protein [Granulicella sibirica]|uniref:TadE/TadG family type IV pilus assembly protein n=1 Tax=Granulicella sibirica TaxID=2479048 RepID=UPI00240D21B5|nr:TadE/TadG family type IV pilus assembly protein [Granulicella sibirica]
MPRHSHSGHRRGHIPGKAIKASCSPGGITHGTSGQSLIEIALMMPLLILLIGYAIDFGYFFIVAANITSAARNAAQFSIQGFATPGQSALAIAGPLTTTTSVAATALGDIAALLNSSTLTAVQVCTKSLGTTGNLANCANYGATASSYTPAADPEAPYFVLQRVDVTYTVQPPIPMSFFKFPLLPQMQFHRQVSMRALD